MTLFWILSAALIVVAMALLAPTLMRQHQTKDDNTQVLNVEIARDRLAELEKAREGGDLSDEEFEQGKQDLQLALAHDLEGTDGQQAASGGSGRGALIGSMILVPLITVPLYFEIGSPNLIVNPPGSPAAVASDQGEMPSMPELAEQLRVRMEENPDNAEGWFLLGRTYMRIENYQEAVKAYEQVVRLMPEEPAGLLSLADALIMSEGQRTGPRAIELLEKTLTLDPQSVTALWLLGNANFENGAVPSAISYWERAYPLLASEPEMQARLGQRITDAGGELPAAPAPLPAIMPTVEAPAATPAPAPATATTTAEPVDGGIRVQVALSPGLMEQAAPGDTVFVLARAENGPPMPLAVARHQVAELPLDVTLTDAMAMMPAMKLSAFPRVAVTAKVSKSGGAATQSGDLLAPTQIVESASPPDSVQLLINQVAE